MSGRRMLGLAAAIACAALAAAAPAAANSVPARPLRIRSASLTQDGRELVWRVELQDSFSPGGLARDNRTLCLLIERAAAGTLGGTVAGQACIVGPAPRSKTPRLVYTPITRKGAGRAVVIAASVSRSNSRDLSATFLPASVRIAYRPLRWQVISTLQAAACVPTPHQTRCVELYPARSKLLNLHTPRVVGCVAAGPSLVSHGPSNRRELALTFDDGPWHQPPTSAFLALLEREHVPATFFEIGRQIATYDPGGAYERRMLADGDMIGDHSWSHPNMTALAPSEQRTQLLDTAAAIRMATGGFTPCLWRPPYGSIDPSLIQLARSLGFVTVMWDVDPRDWATPGVAAIYDNVVSNARDGAIVLQHFGGGPRYQTLAALPEEIRTLRERGYRFVTVTQLLGLRLIYR